MADGLGDDLADRLVLAALPHIPFEGWSPAALRAAERDLALEPGTAAGVFRNPAAAVEGFARLADRKLEAEAEAAAAELAEMRIGKRVGWLVRRRIEAWTAHREAVARAVSLLTLPLNQPAALRSAWHTADAIWHLAGDVSTDISWYTRRATLAGVLAATTLVWLDDKSDGQADSWAFLDRRLADVARLTRLRRDAQTRLQRLPGLLRRDPLRRVIRTPLRKRR